MTLGPLLDYACARLGIDPLADGLQILPARVLDLRAVLVASEQTPGGTTVRAWSEQQGVGAYKATLVPYPLVTTRPALLCALDASNPDGVRAGLLLRYPPAHPLVLLVDEVVSSDPDGVRAGLLLRYPPMHPLVLLVDEVVSREITLTELGSSSFILHPSSLLYLPPLAPEHNLYSADGPAWVAQRLLGPGGCPWDVRQTHQSLRAGLLEEAYEVLEALDAGDMQGLVEELGDLLLQTIVHAEMARQAGHFDLGDVYAALASKLINRHPHVFGELGVAGESQVLRNWESIKQGELVAKGRARASALDGIPPALPALAQAQKLVKKAARVGFDWPSIDGAWAKFREELAEFEAEALNNGRPERISEELGDLLYTIATLAHWLDADAETALRAANAKFRRRFTAIERTAKQQGRELADLSFDEILGLWGKAKQEA